MGARGPAPKPRALKEAQGNPGRRRLNDNEPVPPAGDVAPPSWLSPVGRDIWAQLAPVMTTMRTLTTADVWTFARYCELFARWLELRVMFAGKGAGSTVFPVKGIDANGNEVTKYLQELPQAREYRLVDQLLRQAEREFGLTPSARSRIHVENMGGAPVQSGPVEEDERAKLFRLVGQGGPAAPRTVKKKRRA